MNGGHHVETAIDTRDPATNRKKSRPDPAQPTSAEAGEVGSRVGARTHSTEEATPPLVLIEWEDSFGCSPSWTDLVTDQPAPLVCQSVGWLVHRDDRCVVVVPHVTLDNDDVESRQGCGDMTIPARSILRTVELSGAAIEREA